uniref:Uncharacterized protein n=1 Tax=Mycena chlorophos TaxID=658473 RepID=A0ABQ0LEU8_MYCCL|nr:predicted protein [Mycena chlorophos]
MAPCCPRNGCNSYFIASRHCICGHHSHRLSGLRGRPWRGQDMVANPHISFLATAVVQAVAVGAFLDLSRHPHDISGASSVSETPRYDALHLLTTAHLRQLAPGAASGPYSPQERFAVAVQYGVKAVFVSRPSSILLPSSRAFSSMRRRLHPAVVSREAEPGTTVVVGARAGLDNTLSKAALLLGLARPRFLAFLAASNLCGQRVVAPYTRRWIPRFVEDHLSMGPEHHSRGRRACEGVPFGALLHEGRRIRQVPIRFHGWILGSKPASTGTEGRRD